MAAAGADEPLTAAQVAAGSAREALAAAVRRSLTRPGSVPPAEQHRLIAAERRAEQAVAEYPATARDSDRGNGQVTASAFHWTQPNAQS